MKNFIALIVLLLTVATFAQETVSVTSLGTNGNSIMLYTNYTVAGEDTVASEWFTLANYDGNLFDTYKAGYGILLATSPNITTVLQGSFDKSNVAAVDTLGAVGDSATTFQSGVINLNEKPFPYYRFYSIGLSTNASTATAKFWLYFRKRD